MGLVDTVFLVVFDCYCVEEVFEDLLIGLVGIGGYLLALMHQFWPI